MWLVGQAPTFLFHRLTFFTKTKISLRVIKMLACTRKSRRKRRKLSRASFVKNDKIHKSYGNAIVIFKMQSRRWWPCLSCVLVDAMWNVEWMQRAVKAISKG